MTQTEFKNIAETEDYPLAAHSPLKNYSWAEILNNAADKPHLSPELKAKDEARYQANQYAMEHDEPDAENFDCPEEQIEYYCDKFNLFFDINGNLINK